MYVCSSLLCSGNLLQKDIFVNHDLHLEEIFAIFEYYIHNKIHEPIMCVSFNAAVYSIYHNDQLYNELCIPQHLES